MAGAEHTDRQEHAARFFSISAGFGRASKAAATHDRDHHGGQTLSA
jgi:hypothetical protein